VIQQTIREQLPKASEAEYLLAHGMIDMVVHRLRLRETLARVRLYRPSSPDQAHRGQAGGAWLCQRQLG
jgi:acetyl-CoA carboxylase carboxyl transferase subunit beta